jgi:hypothetical protein
MKLVTLCFFKEKVEGVGGGFDGQGNVLKRHKFNLVRYSGSDPIKMVEPADVSPFINISDLTSSESGQEGVYIEGIEVLPRLAEIGFDDARDIPA